MSRSAVLVLLLAGTTANCGGSQGSASPAESTSGAAEPMTTGDDDRAPHGVELLALSYGGDPAQTIDLYRAQPLPTTPAATVVLAHGGLWQGGDKSELAALCELIVVRSGGAIACASMNYRLSGALGGSCRGIGVETYVEQLADMASAHALLRGQASTLGLDPAQIYIGGHSAGGHLAQVLNLRWSEFASGPPAPGAIGFEGIYDVAAWNAYDADFWNGQWSCATRRAFGGPPETPEVCVDAVHEVPCWAMGSPTYLAAHAGSLGLAPVGGALIMHSPDDDWVDVAEATSFAVALESAFPDLDVIASTDGACGAGSHVDVIGDPLLAGCIVNFVLSARQTSGR